MFSLSASELVSSRHLFPHPPSACSLSGDCDSPQEAHHAYRASLIKSLRLTVIQSVLLVNKLQLMEHGYVQSCSWSKPVKPS